MSPIETSCPACGAPIRFAVGSSVVVVCPSCHSVVARGDRKLEDLGKVAALVDTGSPLHVGRKGKYRGSPFVLTGRAQFSHPAGGTWDEWYASFPADRWGWLAEAQGRFYMTFETPLPATAKLPAFDAIAPGSSLTIPGAGLFAADEVGVGQAKSAEGEIPYRLVPGEQVEFVDLSARGGRFASLDFSDAAPRLYLGEQVSMDAVGIPHAPAEEREPQHVASLQVNCPQCGGALDLKAPDVTERVACPYCHALLDCTQGKLQYLETLKPGRWKPAIPLGRAGTIDGKAYTAIGFLVRHVRIDNENYYWSEYLLYGEGIGFRWLVESDGHWSLVAAVAAGDVAADSSGATYNGRRFRLFQQATAQVDYVEGEFYWKVACGEAVADSDYVSPPFILSREISYPSFPGNDPHAALNRGEVNWSAGVYLPREEVSAAFKLAELRQPQGIAPNQPFKYHGIYRLWGVLAGLSLLLWIGLKFLLPTHVVLDKAISVDAPVAPETATTVFEHGLKFLGHRGVRVTISAPVNNSWMFVDGDLFNEDSDLVQPFELPLEYYHGFDSDGEWSEGSKTESVHVTARPAGNYTLRLEVQWKDIPSASEQQWANPPGSSDEPRPRQPMNFMVHVEETGPRLLYLVIVMLLLSIPPLIVAVVHFSFERRRWSDSEFSPYAKYTSGSDD